MPDTEVYGELVGRNVMVGSVHAVICDYNRFNRPPFTWKYAVDGEEGFGWRENFYLLPTREQIAQALHEHELGDPWDDEGCNDLGDDGEFAPSCKQTYLERADAVLALLSTSGEEES